MVLSCLLNVEYERSFRNYLKVYAFSFFCQAKLRLLSRSAHINQSGTAGPAKKSGRSGYSLDHTNGFLRPMMPASFLPAGFRLAV
jgi:hypothetical protein